MYDVVIIGAGLGGLQCAYILAKHGMNVCVLEREHQLGGCLQTFKRKGYTFDTGFHYVGGMEDGKPLNRIFSYFGLSNLPWRKMDTACFDEISVCGKSYALASGHELFVQTLAADFPDQLENLKKYDAALKNVGDHLFDALRPRTAESFYTNEAFGSSAYEFLNNTITDARLRAVLSGASLKLELCPETLPFYIFAQINNSFVEGSCRLQGGGATLADGLVTQLKNMGVSIMADAEIVSLEADENGVSAAVTADGQKFEAKQFVSDVHPAATLALIGEGAGIRKVYRNRINRMANTYGMFTVNIALKPNTLPYQNKNIYVYNTEDLWHINADKSVQGILMSYGCVPEGEKFAKTLDLLTPMTFEEVEQWKDTKIGRRGADYEALKQQKSEACIKLAMQRIPELKDAIADVYTSSPLTYLDYTATANGSAYGLRKDYNNTMLTFLTPKTPVQNLYLTGQNLNLHGILGTSMTSFVTTAAMIGLDAATDGLL